MEIADVCEAVGTDMQEVTSAIGIDRRIGDKFFHPTFKPNADDMRDAPSLVIVPMLQERGATSATSSIPKSSAVSDRLFRGSAGGKGVPATNETITSPSPTHPGGEPAAGAVFTKCSTKVRSSSLIGAGLEIGTVAARHLLVRSFTDRMALQSHGVF